ncbi:von Willebrand factor [Ophiocordyceps camponoti-floridani]|uniref:von Willebrand factor n=1 Tax=Ophiocordyceps camponoti-floridani TaxID=2030778 RepID=A0A8H4Q3U9_9HYPO|nr:von Willebrand factor [Ophiocordyceps camponoti-floridani]
MESPSEAPPPYNSKPSSQPAVTPATFLDRNDLSSSSDPYHFLYLFDTVFLVDDSSSMLGPRWREVQTALAQLTPVCTSHDDDGIDIYFMNHVNGASSNGGYCGLTDPEEVHAIFRSVRPFGPTPTRSRIEHILNPYFTRLHEANDCQDIRPLNLIVLTDGMPGPPLREDGSNPHLPEPAIVHYAGLLDRKGAPSYQVGIQFIQVGNDAGATRALDDLDHLHRKHAIRDMVDTTKFNASRGTLSAHAILKAVLGGVDRRLDSGSSTDGGR